MSSKVPVERVEPQEDSIEAQDGAIVLGLVFTHAHEARPRITWDEIKERLRIHREAGRKLYLVADELGKTVCAAAVKLDRDAGVAFVDELATLKQSRKHGFGAAALQAVAEDALDMGIDRVELNSTPESVPYYVNRGFVVIDEDRRLLRASAAALAQPDQPA